MCSVQTVNFFTGNFGEENMNFDLKIKQLAYSF